VQGIAILRIEQYREYQLSVVNDSKESPKNRKYLLEFEIKSKGPLDTE
jgi:hypothetical protein